MATLLLNGKTVTVDAALDTPLLWVLRDHLKLTGTKFGCGASYCGACTVHVDGVATRSCVTPLSAVAGKRVTSIEGLQGRTGAAVQAAWDKHQVPQCGYCQSGQVMTAAALLTRNAKPSDAQIVEAMQGNICRCGTYGRIHAAVRDAAATLNPGGDDE
jgi:isoquinoline 1-oxidoreductase alpha subunit